MESLLKEHFMEILSHSPLVVWALDRNGNYLFSEGKPLESLGFDSGALVGKNHFDLFPDQVDANAFILRALAGENLRAEVNFGGRFFATHYSPTKDNNGNVIGMSAISTDITDLKVARSAVASERENLENLFIQVPEMFCILEGPEHIFRFVNASHIAVLGFDATGRSVREAQPESVEIHGILDEVYRTGKTAFLHEIAVTVGSRLRYFNLTYAPRRDGLGHVNGILIMGSEITNRIEANNALSESVRKLRTIADTMPQIVWSANARGDVNYANKKWYEYTGVSDAQTMGFGFAGIIHPEDRDESLEIYRRALNDGMPLEMSHRFRGRDGSYRWFLVRALPHRDETGKITDWFGSCTDIDAQKQIEKELGEAAQESRSASETKSAFLANMSHEIRTPLAAILGFTDLLKDPTLPQEDRVQYLETISRNGQALTRIIDDILDLSKVEAGKLQMEEIEFRLSDILHEVVNLLQDRAGSKGIYIRLDLAPDLPERISSDPVRLRQILINIIGNAVKFTSDGGVQVTAKAAPAVRGYGFKIEVADSGIGLTEEQIRNLFQPFTQADSSTTRKFGGTGLGLVLSRRLAQALGGDISAIPNVPQGSIFTVSFGAKAISKESDAPDENDPSHARNPLTGLRVLVVDDSPDNRMLMKLLLARKGISVSTAEDGYKACELARTGDFDVILMDIQMPGIDGYDTTRQLRQDGYLKPIIALTAHAMREERVRTREAGCNAHLTKPLNFPELIATLEKFSPSNQVFKVLEKRSKTALQ